MIANTCLNMLFWKKPTEGVAELNVDGRSAVGMNTLVKLVPEVFCAIIVVIGLKISW